MGLGRHARKRMLHVLLAFAALGVVLRPRHGGTPASLGRLLRRWAATGGGAPAAVRAACARSAPVDAVRAVLDSLAGGLVVDVGANGGWPVSVMALQRNMSTVSIEPDERNLVRLRRLHPQSAGRHTHTHTHTVVAGAAGAEKATMQMKFHKTRNDFTCFHCLGVGSKDVYTREVNVVTLDDTLALAAAGDAQMVQLLKSDTQGHELEVLKGARELFGKRRVRSTLIEFDPKLLRKKDIALSLLEALHAYGMRCVHLQFSGVQNDTAPHDDDEVFEIKDTRASEAAFYDYVVARGGWTDLFCLRARARL